MSQFSKYRQFYSIPERISNEDARANRLAAVLLKERQAAADYDALSQVAIKNQSILGRRPFEDPKVKGPKAVLTTAALLDQFKEQDFANPVARAAYRSLRASENAHRARSSQKVPPSAADKRQYNPTGKDFASTIYGTIARITNWTNVGDSGAHFQRGFQHASQVIPCVQRDVRRQVMFAKNKAGHGYHTKKSRTWASGVPC